MLNPGEETILRVIAYIYGFDMCPSGQTSAIITYKGCKNHLCDQSFFLNYFLSHIYHFLSSIL